MVRNKYVKGGGTRKLRGGAEDYYVAASLEFELPEKFPHTLSENDIEEIKLKIGQYFADNKVPFTYFGTENNYHLFTTLNSKSAYFDLRGGGAQESVFVDIEISLDTIAPKILSSQDITNMKAKIRYAVKDSAPYLIYKGLFGNVHVFVNDLSVIHGRQF